MTAPFEEERAFRINPKIEHEHNLDERHVDHWPKIELGPHLGAVHGLHKYSHLRVERMRALHRADHGQLRLS